MLLTERGLGGNDVDLRHRLDRLRRDRSQRARRRAAYGGGMGESCGAVNTRQARVTQARRKNRRRRLLGARLSRSHREKPRRRARIHSCWRMAAGGRSIRSVRLRANHSWPSPNWPEGQRRAASCWPRRSRSPKSKRALPRISKIARRSFSTRPAHLCARARAGALGALVLNEQTVPVPADERAAATLAEGIAAARCRTPALDQITAPVARPRDVSAPRRRRGMAAICLTPRLLQDAGWLTPYLAGKTALSQFSADEFAAALQSLLPHPLPRRLEKEAPTHFTAPTGSHIPIEYTEEGPKIAIRVQELFGLDTASRHRQWQDAADHRTALACASAGAGDARPAGFLARQLCGGESRDARAAIRGIPGRTIRRELHRRAAPSRAALKLQIGYSTLRRMLPFRLIHRSTIAWKAAWADNAQLGLWWQPRIVCASGRTRLPDLRQGSCGSSLVIRASLGFSRVGGHRSRAMLDRTVSKPRATRDGETAAMAAAHLKPPQRRRGAVIASRATGRGPFPGQWRVDRRQASRLHGRHRRLGDRARPMRDAPGSASVRR